MIQLTPVISSNIEAIGFDPASSSLFIEFKPSTALDPTTGAPRRGKVIVYRGMTKELFDRFLTSPSVGKFYHAEIRGKFLGEEVEIG